MWEEVITENPPTVAVWEEGPDETIVHIYRNGVRLYEYLSPNDARDIIAELQEAESERLTDFGEYDGEL